MYDRFRSDGGIRLSFTERKLIMLYVISGTGSDPFYNLAAEQVIFDHLDRTHSYLYLWQNDNTVVIGRYQNTYAQIDPEAIRHYQTKVVRRLSGGGAVYHDLDNLNYSFITDAGPENRINFRFFLEPVADVLSSLGVQAEINGRNDLTVDGKKFSGSAQYIREGRVMHHGTLLFNCDTDKMSRILRVPAEKIRSRGVASVKSRVCRLKDYLPADYQIDDFRNDLIRYLSRNHPTNIYTFSPEEEEIIREVKKSRYETWEWNYGSSPACTVTKSTYLPEVGSVELNLSIDHGILTGCQIYGDFFSAEGPEGLIRAIKGCPLREDALKKALEGVDIPSHIRGLKQSALLHLLLF